MKKALMIILGIIVLPLLFLYILGSDDGSDIAVAEAGKPQIIKFTSTTCYECQKINKIFKELLPSYGGKYAYKELVLDRGLDFKDSELVEKYNVKVVPTVILLNSDGSFYKKIEGAPTKSNLDSYIRGLK